MKHISWVVAAIVAFAGQSAMSETTEALFTPGEGPFDWVGYDAFATGHEYPGQVVTILGPWLAAEARAFQTLAQFFEAATGATVSYVGSDSLEQKILIDAEAGAAPNLTVFPQPGLAADLAARGFLAPFDEADANWLRDHYAAGQSWVDLGRFPGADGDTALFGFFFNVNVKSLVWYVPDTLADFGYETPKSLEELKTLTDQIVADGHTPWCIGLGSGGATGWPATDWVEELLLRSQPPEVYDAWTTNALRFDDPIVIDAIKAFGWFLDEGRVSGGRAAVGAIDFRDAPKGLFAAPPTCFMHRQGSFIPAYFPDGTEMGVDADFFYFPAFAEKDLGKPVLGAGTMMSITADSAATRGFVSFLQTAFAHEIMMAQPGFLTPHKSARLSAYSDETRRAMAEILLSATAFRFDGSDLMPGAVGTGSFWSNMVDYTVGKSAADVAADIQASWDDTK